jgi:hypothetical protein
MLEEENQTLFALVFFAPMLPKKSSYDPGRTRTCILLCVVRPESDE